MQDEDRPNSAFKRIQKSKESRGKAEELLTEYEAQWSRILNSFLTTEDGKLFARIFIGMCRVFDVEDCKDQVQIIKSQALRNLYLEGFRPFLDNETIREIEYLCQKNPK